MKIVRVQVLASDQSALKSLASVISSWARVARYSSASLESQQLVASGTMPAADVAVIDLRTIRQSELARLVADSDDAPSAHDVVVIKHPDETTIQRVDREEVEGVLRDNGFTVFNSTDKLAESLLKTKDRLSEDTGTVGVVAAPTTSP